MCSSDLFAAPKSSSVVHVASKLPSDQTPGFDYQKAGDGAAPKVDDNTFMGRNPSDNLIQFHVGAKSVSVEFTTVAGVTMNDGLLERVVNQEETTRLRAASKAIVILPEGNTLFQSVWTRQQQRTPPKEPSAADTRKELTVAVPKDKCAACPQVQCGQGNAIAGSVFYQVVTGCDCGDFCHAELQLYDPQTREFVGLEPGEQCTRLAVERLQARVLDPVATLELSDEQLGVGAYEHGVRREGERRLLAVEIGELGFQLHVVMRGAGNIARAARPRPRPLDGLLHGGKHLGVLAHAEIVVAAPDRDRLHAIGGVQFGRGEGTALAQNVGENPIPAFPLQLGQRILEDLAIGVRHGSRHSPTWTAFLYDRFRRG